MSGGFEVEWTYTSEVEPNEKTQFALIYPYSYKRCQMFLDKLQAQWKGDKNIYFHKEVLIKSPEGRNINLLTISSYDRITKELNTCTEDDLLFPEKAL